MKERAQELWPIRCEWGLAGLDAVGGDADVVIVVDVLSFSTCVDVAVSRGAEILPVAWKDERAAEFARERSAALAGPRGQAGFSLSPASFLSVEPGARVALPSPNGATLSARRASAGGVVLCGCLRNAAAVAGAARRLGRTIAVIPAGERWEDGSLRPALEDGLGAGAILAGLGEELSPEARAAREAFAALESRLAEMLEHCASGRELISRGFESDVRLAAELNVSRAVPLLQRGAYHALGEIGRA
ncbi:MAG TPA: 2-phosphosulfolactate phosphatase [Candidatus Sulfotelmatobacter sp.]|nr:2-phosphosulfolactate phosphatase [Candidatus Sulfotelmatobacter sp.]